MLETLTILLPVFLVMGIGFGLTQLGLVTREVQRGLVGIAYWVGLPCLLFVKISLADLSVGHLEGVYVAVFAAMVACYMVARLAGGVGRLPPSSMGAFVHASFRGNLAFVALPVVEFSLFAAVERSSNPEATRAAAEIASVAMYLALAYMVIWYNILGVLTLLVHQKNGNAPTIMSIVRKWLTNPLIIACVAGWLCNRFAVPLPVFVERTCTVMGQAALAMALMGIGAQLALTKIRTRVSWAVGAAIIKVVVAPLVAGVVGYLLGLDSLQLLVALVMSASPTAVASYVLTDQMGGDPDLAANSVAVSTVLAFASFSVILLVVS